MADPVELAERITDLEVKVAFQDRLIASLDDVVRRFSARVERLEQELVELRAGDKSPPLPVGPASDPPPHY
jgi:SlyX protein